jgi:copper chaperone CopZ
MTTLTYSVPGISCGHCKNAIESEVRDLPGVESAVVDIEARVVVVEGSASEEAVRSAVVEAGYEVDSVS